MSDDQKRALKELTQTPGFGETNWEPFVEALEFAVKYFLGYRELAKGLTSAGVRATLLKALKAAERFEQALTVELDGYSRAAVYFRFPKLFEEAACHTRVLRDIVELADRQLPRKGQRIQVERDHFAALVLEALRTHTSAPANQIKGGFFEQVLIFSFSCAGMRTKDLHTLVERACKDNLVEKGQGTTLIHPRQSVISAANP